MLSPKAHGPRPPSADGADPEPTPRAFAEPRSFAPTSEAETVQARRPPLWAGLAPDTFVSAPLDGPEPPVDARKRALIVIPTLNEAEVVARVIARVLEDDGLIDPLVIVVDGGSQDATREIVREIATSDRRVCLLDNPGRLQSVGLNLAASAAAGDRPWLVRVDAHADYPPNYASSLIEEAMLTGAASVVVSMDTVGEAGFQRAVAAAQNSLLGTGGSAHRLAASGQWVDHGHHALFDLAAFDDAGGYDETFSHNEDAEFDLRLVGRGGKIWLTDKVRIGYHPRGTPRALWRQYFSYGRGGRALS